MLISDFIYEYVINKRIVDNTFIRTTIAIFSYNNYYKIKGLYIKIYKGKYQINM